MSDSGSRKGAGGMIADLDKTLRELLNRELLKIPLDFTITPDQISFATPDATFAPTA
jgi:hypothetical protein